MIAVPPLRPRALDPSGPARVAVGVMAHNEAASIAHSLTAILAEPDGPIEVSRVVVVASGCTDGTEDVVRRIAAIDGRVDLIVQPERAGKASAINLFLGAVEEPYRVLVGADVVCQPGALTHLVLPLVNGGAAMTGARPVPVNARRGVTGRAAHALWDLHHAGALERPKLGEAVAFTDEVRPIDPASLVDEVSLEHQVIDAGGRLAYVPDAVVRNRAPGTVRDYIAQRRRIHLGHLRVSREQGYRPSTMSEKRLVQLLVAEMRRAPRHIPDLVLAMVLEVVARAWAMLRLRLRRGPVNGAWRPIASTKTVALPGQSVRAFHHTEHTLRIAVAPPIERRERRRLRRVVLEVVREDDIVEIQGRDLIVRFKGSPTGGVALANRLRAALTPQYDATVLDDTESQSIILRVPRRELEAVAV